MNIILQCDLFEETKKGSGGNIKSQNTAHNSGGMLRSVLTALRAVLGLAIAAFWDGLAAISNHIGLAANVIQPRIVMCNVLARVSPGI